MSKLCKIEDCENPVLAKDLCSKHRWRMNKYGECSPRLTYGRTHGQSHRTRTYVSWDSMIQRCTNPKTKNWRWYGAMGVAVCDRWRKFANFYEDMGDRPEGMTLDRINPAGNYEPGNCRWADSLTQGRNKRR